MYFPPVCFLTIYNPTEMSHTQTLPLTVKMKHNDGVVVKSKGGILLGK